ncbi:MAG: alpha/beta hydrolase [Mycobacterium leprae]
MATITSRTIDTARLKTHFLESGPADGIPFVLVHGNLSTGTYYTDLMAQLPAQYHVIAPDLRGFGDTEPQPIDALRGLRDFTDDLHALFQALGLTQGGRKIHLLGWSVGGPVVMQYAIDHPDLVASLILEDPMSPYGFGGTRDAKGNPCFDDWAGTGGGTANPDFAQRLASGDRSVESPNSPRNVMNSFYFKPPFRLEPAREEELITELLKTRSGEGFYPGDMALSPNWPTVKPGTKGMNNAISGKYCNVEPFARINPRPPVLWLRGADDQIVSDTSLFDFGFLGQIGAVPGWPGAEVYPAQPMVSQMRYVLDQYVQNGGSYQEEVIANSGHSPHLEQADTFRSLVIAFVNAHA